MKKTLKKWWFWVVIALLAVIITRAVMVAKALKAEKAKSLTKDDASFMKKLKAFFTLPLKPDASDTPTTKLNLGASDSSNGSKTNIVGNIVAEYQNDSERVLGRPVFLGVPSFN